MLKSITAHRPYLYEIDLVRASTAFTVVAIHSISTVGFLATTGGGSDVLNAFVHALHYNREVFMFITGLVLTYVYYYRDIFSVKMFYLNRLQLIFVPYVLWTIIYVIVNDPGDSFGRLVYLSFWNTLTGNASSQLYYILLTLQFCAIFPLFLLFLRKMSRQPAKTLVISFIVQIVLIFLDYHVLQAGRFSTNQAVTIFVEFQNRYLPLYEFFFVLGGFAALYIDTCKVFLANYGRYIPALMAGALTLFVLYYVLQLQGLHYSLGLATQVLQPSVVLYSTVVIVFFCWVASKWAIKRRLYKIVKSVADTSFGIYFVHILILNYLVQHALPHLSDSIPVPIKIIGLIIATFSLAASFCYILFRIPLLSWTIGKVQPLKFPKFRTTTPS